MASKSSGGISIGTLIFWGFIGWYWFGDNIKEFFSDKVDVKIEVSQQVNENSEEVIDEINQAIKDAAEKIKAEEVMDNINGALKDTTDRLKKLNKRISDNIEKEENKEVIPQEKTQENSFSNDDRYGDYEEKW